MKKLLSLILCMSILLGTLSLSIQQVAAKAWTPAYTTVTELPKPSNVIARLVVGSDVHIGYKYASDKFQNAYDVLGMIGGVDVFALAGDLTEMGTIDEYNELMRIVTKNTKELTVDREGFTAEGAGSEAPVGTTILAMGNHEYYDQEDYPSKVYKRFEEKTGQAADKLYWIGGKIPLIKLAMNGTESDFAYFGKEDFLRDAMEEIDKSGWKGHVFLISHVECGDSGSVSKQTKELLKKYPQIINVWGHTHSNPYNPTFIDQSCGYTTMNDGIVGKSFGDDAEIGSTGIMFDVMSDGTTKFYRIDFQNGRILFPHENWVLDASDKPEDFIYFSSKSDAVNPNSYILKASTPYFKADDYITVKDMGDNDSVEVTFPKASTKTNNNYDYIRNYYISAIPVNGDGEEVNENISSPDHLPGGFESDMVTAIVDGLDWNVDYRFEVSAHTTFGHNSNVLTNSDTVNVGMRDLIEKPKLLYDIDYSYGSGNDLMGHTSNPAKMITITKDDTIGRYAANFREFNANRYDFDENDLEDIRYEFTIETYVYLADPSEKQEILGMYNVAGLSLGVENNKIYVLLGSKYEETDYYCKVPVKSGGWVHIAVTYDSKNLSLYINGNRAVTERCTGGLGNVFDDDFTDAEKCFFVGGRSGTGDNPLLLKKGSKVNCVRIYKGAMDSMAVKSAYESTTSEAKDFSFSDVDTNDWFHTPVLYSYTRELMNGTSATAFSPAVATSRAMIVQLLYNMEGRPEVEYKPIFTDVKEDTWYADAVIWAYENGVTTGSSATTFSPDALVTREQVAVFLYRFMKDYKKAEMAEGADLSAFPDADKISSYAGFAEAMSWANGVGIITGKTSADGAILAPLDNAQRCESATMFARFHRSFVA